MFVPKESSHPLAEATASEPGHDKELVNVVRAGGAHPFVGRSDDGEPRDRVTDLSQIRITAFRPNGGRIVGITSVGVGINLEEL
jgi:hypothetical protein